MQVECNSTQAATNESPAGASTSATVGTSGASAKCITTTNVNKSSKQQRGALKDVGILKREDFDGGPVSLDEIVCGLYLGNLTAATHMMTLKIYRITHILTLDSVPLPQHITEASFLTTKYVQISDMKKEDILHHLDSCTEFIESALAQEGNVLVHCYYGVSRSSAAVIAFIMKSRHLDYQAAFEMVRKRRRFVQPNIGFVYQLKLYGSMGCKIDTQYQPYKIYRLRLAGDQVLKAKILPQSFNSLIQADPAVTQENPEPIVYRCRKCRRVLASKAHILQHDNRSLITQTPPKASGSNIASNNGTTAPQASRLLEKIAVEILKTYTPTDTESQSLVCRNIIFVEPIAWMRNITHNTQGRLNCPKCEQKVGNFSWINGCQCPCGEVVTPAFYLIPSRVELSKAVQNVQTTL
ncbi:dual specificity protein phosphatase MPK-4 [Ceratitis capitata]|uniref:Dual specificity protein phosphatase 12 n=1 Tax=Ceratitis capitata TaxID=7213 RepID=W8BQB5_CERCA|nr:dual specificity protein phosphatase MPK-4 [Ceratitis capitata]